MKRLFIISLILLSSCNSEYVVDSEIQTKQIHFGINCKVHDFPETKFNFTKPSEIISSIHFFDFEKGILTNKIDQNSIDENYGCINSKLKYGVHQLFIVGSNTTSNSFSQDNKEMGFDNVSDTFIWSQDLIVNKSTPSDILVKLKRCISKIEIEAMDPVPLDAYSVDIIVKKGFNSFCLSTGDAVPESSSTTKTFIYSESQKGMKNTLYSIFSFVPKNDAFVDVDINVKDKSGDILYKRSFKQISIFKNKIIHFSGVLFIPESIENSFSIDIENDWNEIIKIDY